MGASGVKTWLRRGLALFALASWLPGASANDGFVGRWWGETGTTKERVSIGLEITESKDGSLSAKLTQPVINYYGLDIGVLTRDGDSLRKDSMHLLLRRDGERLVGHFPGPNSPLQLQRARRLPEHPDPPKLPTTAEPRWQTRIGGQVYASPVVYEGVVYLGGSGGVLNAIDAQDGRVLWATALGAAIHAAVAVDAEAVYVASDLALHRLDRRSGKQVWRYPLLITPVARVLPHPAVFDWDWQGAAPLIAGDSVYVGAGDGLFHAVARADGAARWRFATGGKIRSGAAADGERILVGSEDGWLYALQSRDGREVWRFDTGAAIDATPVLHAGKVLIGNRGYGLFSLHADSGELDWKQFFWGSWVESTPVVVDGVIYIGASDLRRVSAIDPSDGRVLWRTDVFGWSWGTPLVDGELIYAAAAGGEPYFIRHQASVNVLDRRSGRLLQRRPLPDSGGHQWGIAGSPVRAGALVLVASIEGALYGFPRATPAALPR